MTRQRNRRTGQSPPATAQGTLLHLPVPGVLLSVHLAATAAALWALAGHGAVGPLAPLGLRGAGEHAPRAAAAGLRVRRARARWLTSTL